MSAQPMPSAYDVPATYRPRGQRTMAMILIMFAVLVVAACAYVACRTFFQVISLQWTDWYLAGSSIIAILLLLTEAFVMFQSLVYARNFYSALNAKALPRVVVEDWAAAPTVAILMPARHEPYDVLERTLLCLKNIDYPNKTIYFLDDSSDNRFLKEAEELATTYGIRLFRRDRRHGAKAGIVNDCVSALQDDYIVIFDADQNPTPGFLKDLVPIMLANPRLAFVQTPQFYTNTERSPIVRGANLQHCMFYEYICEGKGAENSMILCGTNAIIRRAAFKDVGGLDEGSITEDFATTIDWHSHGWDSAYSGRVCTFGSGPETLDVYFKQQWRWSRGNLGVFFKVLRTLATRPTSMTFRQWWEHFGTGSYYAIGICYMILMICPITQIFWNMPVFHMNGLTYAVLFLPYYLLSTAIFFASMHRRNYKFGDLLVGVLLGFISFPIYVRSFFGALLGVRAAFNITDKSNRSGVLSYRLFWPQILMWALNFYAFVWGVNRLAVEQTPQLLVSLFWVFYHFALLSSIFYFRMSGQARWSERPALQGVGA